jgi:hypothetical protein
MKGKALLYQVMKTQRRDEMLGFHPSLTFGKTRMAKVSGVHTGCTLQKFLGKLIIFC